MRVVFMGTPEFALPSLRALIAREEVAAVITQPDRPKGRGEISTAPPVKEIALIHGIPVLQPEKVRRPELIREVEALRPELIVVVAFGQILPKALLAIPRNGCVNVHASLLPAYRGAAPIPWAIMRGERQTGVTTMLMDEGMDTGPILLERTIEIGPGETSGGLSERLSRLGAELLLETLDRLSSGTLHPVPQDREAGTYAPLLKKEDGLIDWSRQAVEIERQVLAMDPWPGAFTFYRGERWRLWSVVPSDSVESPGKPGEIVQVTERGLEVATGKGYINIKTLQPENRRRMAVREFLAGHRVQEGSLLTPS